MTLMIMSLKLVSPVAKTTGNDVHLSGTAEVPGSDDVIVCVAKHHAQWKRCARCRRATCAGRLTSDFE